MNFKEVEQLVAQNKLEKILEELQPIFDKIDTRSQRLMTGQYTTGDEADKLLMRCTGWWGYLNSIYITLDTIKDQKETRLFNTLKMEYEKKKVKVVSTVLEREVSDKIMPIRRIRNLVGAYRDVCDKNIFSCQSLLKSLNEGFKRTRD